MGPPPKRQKVSELPSQSQPPLQSFSSEQQHNNSAAMLQTQNMDLDPKVESDPRMAEDDHKGLCLSRKNDEFKRDAMKERNVGILHFVNGSNPGFSGVLKQR